MQSGLQIKTMADGKRLGNFDNLPGRPFESIACWWAKSTIILSMRDPDLMSAPLPDDRKWFAIARYDGERWEFKRGAQWYWLASYGRDEWTEAHALCYQVMLNSDHYCANQAVIDTTANGDDPRWQAILDEAKELWPIADILLT